jgi:cytochrome c oxidase assembly protein subunit 15
VRIWLLVVAALVFAVVLVGGATRLTESGLSITEWKPVTGTLPPFTDSAWQAEFDKYKAIPQYQQINRGMSLSEFKTIFWWEWGHRLLGRLIGAAFLLPFLWFLWRGWVPQGFRLRLWGIFALGGLQGAVGWWMVASGLSERVSVSQYRLAFHLTLACVIYAALVWVALALAERSHPAMPRRLRLGAVTLLTAVIVQIYLGALVAGLDAGLVYNTWPLIDGAWVPSSARLMFLDPAWRNFFENELTVQFVHRLMAYALWAGAVAHAVDAFHTLRRGPAVTLALGLAGVVTLQAAVGIATLLAQSPIWLALTHQGVAVVVLTLAVLHAQRQVSGGRRSEAAEGTTLLSRA